jgi:hypothetical protein
MQESTHLIVSAPRCEILKEGRFCDLRHGNVSHTPVQPDSLVVGFDWTFDSCLAGQRERWGGQLMPGGMP